MKLDAPAFLFRRRGTSERDRESLVRCCLEGKVGEVVVDAFRLTEERGGGGELYRAII